jgi:hypothetical protein
MTQQLGGERNRIKVKIDNLTQARKSLDELIWRRRARGLYVVSDVPGGRGRHPVGQSGPPDRFVMTSPSRH